MFRLRRATRLAFVVSALVTFSFAGCSDESSTGPEEEAPALPTADQLAFDFSFFDQAQGMGGLRGNEHSHFFNAYSRAAILNLLTHLVMTPPVAAFAVAHSVPPSLQDDGSWIWVYTHVNGANELQIRLRGALATEGVDWELRVSHNATTPPLDNALWFGGNTSHEGRVGTWTFYDIFADGNPVSGHVDWDSFNATKLLRFTNVGGEGDGDKLEYTYAGTEHEIVFNDASATQVATIAWHDDNHGWLQVPEYNSFAKACWDVDFFNTSCLPPQ